jgi:hypothetical protein
MRESYHRVADNRLNQGTGGGDATRSIPRFDGEILSQAWKEASWDKFAT